MNSARLSSSQTDLRLSSPRHLYTGLPPPSPRNSITGLPVRSPVPSSGGAGPSTSSHIIDTTETEEWMKEVAFDVRELISEQALVTINGEEPVEKACKVRPSEGTAMEYVRKLIGIHLC